VTTERHEIDGAVRRIATWFNVVVAALVTATVVMVTWPRIADAIGSPAVATDVAPAYGAGETIDVPVEWYADSSHTLILFAQSRCGACLNAQGFLADLIATVDGQAAVVLASPAGRHEAELHYALSLGIPDQAVFAAPPGLRARVTPTLVLVDHEGTVLHAWEGAPPDQQAAISAAVADALTPTPPAGP
jgi:hypothetical protein